MNARSESGYALLFVYAMAATIALMFLMELPRAAFEAQRDKEQLLIDRGEQYSRAVKLFVRKFNRYPPDLDALDNTQNLRFLRSRYVDPLTGKDEWRLIHVGPGGVFTDSLVYGKKKDGDKTFEPQNFITEMQQTGGNQTDPSQGGVNIATRTRPSDQPGAAGDPNNPQSALPPPQPGQLDGSQPGSLQPGGPLPGMPQAGLNQSGLTQPGLPQFDSSGQPIPNTGAAQTAFPNGLPPGIQLPPGMQLPPGLSLPGQNPTGQMGTTAPAGASLINQILTNPRPGGLPGLNPQASPNGPTVDQYGNPVQASNPLTGNANGVLGANAATTGTTQGGSTGQVIGGGIAGVASKREQEGIKIYKERKKYNEWEFVYDITKDASRTGGAGATPAAAQGQAGQTGQTGPTGQQSQSPFQTSQQSPQQTQPPQPNAPGTPTPAPSQ